MGGRAAANIPKMLSAASNHRKNMIFMDHQKMEPPNSESCGKNTDRWEASPPLQTPQLTLPHAHTALPKPPDFARGQVRHLPESEMFRPSDPHPPRVPTPRRCLCLCTGAYSRRLVDSQCSGAAPPPSQYGLVIMDGAVPRRQWRGPLSRRRRGIPWPRVCATTGPCTRGGGGGLRSGGVKSNCENLRENCERLRENCGAKPNLPKPEGATLLHRGHTGHRQTRKEDKQKVIAGKLWEKCEIAKLRKLADLNPPLPPAACTQPTPRTNAGCRCRQRHWGQRGIRTCTNPPLGREYSRSRLI